MEESPLENSLTSEKTISAPTYFPKWVKYATTSEASFKQTLKGDDICVETVLFATR